MNETLTNFERLVHTLESSERQDMLRRLAEATEIQEEALRASRHTENIETDQSISPDAKFLEEPFLVRVWFFILSFFNSTSPSRLYSEHLVSSLGKKLTALHGLYIDTRQRCYTDAFYQELVALKKAQDFFSTLLLSYEDDKGGFIIILSSLLMKQTNEAILTTTDPFSIPYDQELKKDVRLSFIREMDAIFLAIPEEERSPMYQAVQAIEWIRKFSTIPLDRLLLRFNVVSGVRQTCVIDLVESELKELVNILYSAKKISFLLLEALYLFAVQDKILEEKFDLEKECSSFVSTAASHISEIRQFKSSFSLVDFVRYTLRDITWQPELVEGGEDWFLLFKNAWKKRFDEKWTRWNRLYRKAMVEKNIRIFLDTEELPTLQYHPWDGMWLPLVMRGDLALSFIKGFFNAIYPTVIMRPLKILLLDGDFYRRENLIEYTDAFSTLEHQQQQIELFEKRLSPKGDIGEGFMLAQKDSISSVKGKIRLENLMLSTEFEAENLIGRVKVAFNSIDAILGGILGVVRGGPYETLINMASIQGKQNERFRKELENVRQLLRTAIGIFSDIEIIEKESQ